MDLVQAPDDNLTDAIPRLEPDVSTPEIVAAGAVSEAIETDYWWLTERQFRGYLDKALDVATVANGLFTEEDLANKEPGFASAGGAYEFIVDPLNREASIVEYLSAARQKRPDLFEGIPVTRPEITEEVNKTLKAEHEEAQKVLSRAPEGFLSRTAPEFIGRMGTALTDETNVAITVGTLGVGSQATLGRLMLIEGGLGVLGEAATLPKQFRISDRLDLPEPNVPLQLAFGGVVGAATPALLKGGLRVASGAVEGVAVTNRAIVQSLRKRASDLSPEERAAQHALERQIAEEDAGPQARGSDNWRDTDEATAAIDEGRPLDLEAHEADPDRVEALTTPSKDTVGPTPHTVRPVEDNVRAMIRDSEARNSYNTPSDFSVIAPPRPLTKMTLNEIDAWQTENINAGAQSTAAGGYQIIRDTLRDLRENLGLTGNEVFNEDLQDRLADELMRDAGLDAFKAGELPAEAFADNLAEIWAAFPTASGRSFYDGDGLNAATIGRQQVLDVLGGEIFVSGRRAPPVMSRVQAASVGVDAQTYQFRTNVNSDGVESPLDRVTEWDELLAGDVIIHERRDGSRWIADGHHRRDLANRLEAQGHAPIEFNAFVLREDEGYSIADVRAIAAVKNIEAGNASAIDAAKVLRVDPAMLEKLTLRNSYARDARGLLKLSDDNFDIVTNGLVREDFAALVGELTSDAELQGGILRTMISVKPRNLAEARQVAADAHRSGLERAARDSQASLFGDDFEPAETLFKERAEVFAKAMSQLRNDRRVFRTLVRDQDRIKGEGNALNETRNAARVSTDETAIGLIEKLVNRAGPLDDALNAAARGVRNGNSVRSAVSEFVGSVRSEIEGGDTARLLDGADGRSGDAATPDGRADEGAEAGREQGSDPNAVVEGSADTASDDIPADRAELGELVASGADRATIDTHPAMVRALEEMEARPETHVVEGYNTEAWHSGRTYVFDGEEVTGTEAALDRWVEDAKSLAWRELGITPQDLQPGGKEVTFLLGPPAAGKSTIANEIAVARGAAILDSDEIKKTIPEFDGGIGASAVHEESSDLSRLVEADLIADGFNVVVPKVGGSAASIERAIGRFKDAGYEIRLVNMAVTAENAYQRMIGRFVGTGRLINPAYVDAVGERPSSTFRALKQKGIADGYAEINNNGGKTDAKPVSELEGVNPLEGSSFDPNTIENGGDLRASGSQRRLEGDEPGNEVNPSQAPRQAELEATEAGDQLVTPGVRALNDQDRLAAQQNAPLRGGSEPADGGLFDLGARDQTDMFSDAGRDLFDDPAASPEIEAQTVAAENAVRSALDAGEVFQVPTGRTIDGQPELIDAADLLADLDADADFLGALDACRT